MPGLTAIFLLFTILTSATGFLFPFTQLLPSHMIGILSLVLLAIACIALYVMKLAGPWRWIYVVTAMISLYFNVFVLVIQSFLKMPALHALAPGESAGRAGVRGGAGHRAGVLRARDHRRVAALQADGVRLIGVKSFRSPGARVSIGYAHRMSDSMQRGCVMPTITTKDGIEIFYKDWG